MILTLEDDKSKIKARNIMKIRIENNDKIFIKDNCIEVYAKNEKYCFDKSEIEEINIITTDLGPFYDDMCFRIAFISL